MAIQSARQRDSAVLMSAMLESDDGSWVGALGVEDPDELGDRKAKDEKKEIWVWVYT